MNKFAVTTKCGQFLSDRFGIKVVRNTLRSAVYYALLAEQQYLNAMSLDDSNVDEFIKKLQTFQIIIIK